MSKSEVNSRNFIIRHSVFDLMSLNREFVYRPAAGAGSIGRRAPAECREVNEILSGKTQATGLVDARLPLQNRRLSALPLTSCGLNLATFGY